MDGHADRAADRQLPLALTAFGTGRVYLDDGLVIDVPATPNTETRYFNVHLVAGQAHDIRIEYLGNRRRRRS